MNNLYQTCSSVEGLFTNILILIRNAVEQAVDPVHLIHGIIQEELEIRHPAHIFSDFGTQGLAQARVIIFQFQQHFLFVIRTVYTDVYLRDEQVGRHFYLGNGYEFIASVNEAAFLGEQHTEVAPQEFPDLFLTNRFLHISWPERWLLVRNFRG